MFLISKIIKKFYHIIEDMNNNKKYDYSGAKPW